jgi:hypothetical protein
MTKRDRLMLMGIVALALLLGAWFMVVAPERERASTVTAEVQQARQQLAAAESQAASASGARARYTTAYSSLVSLGQAVPASAETPALIYALEAATHSRNVQFSSITNASTGTSSTPTVAAHASAGFSQQQFTFVFSGSFVDLYKLLAQLEGFTTQTPAGALRVNGRLLTIDSVVLAPGPNEAQSSAGASGSSTPKSARLTATIIATAYVLPTGQSALAGATTTGPSGAQPASNATSGSGGGATAAVVRVNP